MKVRIGVGPGAASPDAAGLGELVDALADLGFDSLWVSDVLTAPGVDALVGLAWAAGHHPRLKLGTTAVAPGRNPLRLAKELATLDTLSGGRLLVTLVPGLPREPESGAIGAARGDRGRDLEEALDLARRLWRGEQVSWHRGDLVLERVTLSPRPVQDPLEVWLGGMAPAALERCGRLADGWLPSLCTPEEAASGRRVVEDAAARAGRRIDPEHFGASVAYATAALDEPTAAAVAARSRGQAPEDVVPVGLSALRTRLEAFIAVGTSKFVLRPLKPPADWAGELEALAAAVGDLQT
ncbi:MAG TPA: LLM class flavin-dependent oxidoreductase [Acidimicrobiales bacterium]|jgi:probable F420-dependent oxidoreductase|nr:LLM class flavin-dependent oxidoreductase [Acidimicrobiales bacterium]